MAEKLLHLEVFTPEKQVLDCNAAWIDVPTPLGRTMVLFGHAAMLAAITPGTLRYSILGKEEAVAVDRGFMEVKDNWIKVLVQSAKDYVNN